MATKEQLLARQKELTAKIASLSKVDVTATTASQRMKSLEATKELRAELVEVNRQLSGKPKTPPKSNVKVPPLLAKPKLAANAPLGLTEDILNDLSGVIDVTNEAVFRAGGEGSTAFVYFGEENKPADLKFKDGKPVPFQATPNIGFVNTVINDFWTDEALQNKIVGAYAAKGKSITQLQAYEIWKGLVSTAASIYQGGRGGKVTPMQLLADTLKGVKGDEPTLPERTISKLDKAEYFSAMDKWASSSTSLMRTLKEDEKEELFKVLEKLNQGTVTTYKKVKNKQGKMENVRTITPGLTAEQAQATVEQKLMELNPDDADRAARIRFADWLSGSVEGI
jgi:hypothetical protein